MTIWDVVVIGAGPAGMSAALEARTHGLSVLVLDEQTHAGGQIFRGIEQSNPSVMQALGKSYQKGQPLVAKFAHCGAVHQTGADAWFIDPAGLVVWSKDEVPHRSLARRVILATGAMERPIPFPGWTLPGVMGAGAAQIALKASATVAPHAVFAGSGPLLFLAAAQYLRLGVPVRAVIDMTPKANYRTACRHISGALMGTKLLMTGVGLIRSIHQARVPLFFGASSLEARGQEQIEEIMFRHRDRSQCITGVKTLFVHQGVVPNTALAAAAGCKREWDAGQMCWRIATDSEGRTSEPRIVMAGDAGRIVGADCSALTGRRAALAIARDLGALSERDHRVAVRPLDAAMKRNRRIRGFLDALYRPAQQAIAPLTDATIICRCENVSAGALSGFVSSGGFDLNQFKSETRCGMGPCQGRMCGQTLAIAMSAASGEDPSSATAPPRSRPPVRPVRLDELAPLAGQMEKN
ncbi:NAD(P)/FAD-dependent oxidoreductase [Acidovorax sp. SUPP2522]|uniref:NAD(P)/FAD-dependent oxidoreductase n=1 Tax=unclassified Acidovorax TaxID=2684926 RepID=UPI00234950CC|nr:MULTISPECIES: FAD/NAD(P)-binding oxidoreductase [unclassified Acidovorax]WCM96137.1 NAD(P)/FAD-dependent oxidoreductase [Acidovorax sp. GBBC 1281]GKT19942.1 NAD(P)/FAD-dependent oxidoreductase [Acidovorax sp. SUPP2522]